MGGSGIDRQAVCISIDLLLFLVVILMSGDAALLIKAMCIKCTFEMTTNGTEATNGLEPNSGQLSVKT